MKKALLFLLTISIIQRAAAGGFQVNLQGIKQNGMAQTGTGLSQDAASTFLNPGALAFLKYRFNVNSGMNFAIGTIGYQEPAPGFYTAATDTRVGTPLLFYASYRIGKKDKWTAAFAVNNPFGNGLRYDDDWKGQFVIREIELKSFNFQPTFSYKINDKMGIGAGVSVVTGSILLRRGIPVADSSGAFGEAELEGKALGFGANLGFFYQINPKFSLGVNYRLATKMKVNDGEAKFDVPSAISDSFPDTKFTTDITLPMVASIGFGYKPVDKLTLALDVNYTGWYQYDTLKFDYDFNSEQLEDTELAREYKGSFTFRIGAQYQIVEKFAARLGFYYDLSPVQDDFLSPESPDANRLGTTVGLSYNPNRCLGIDASFMYIRSLERSGGSEEAGFYGSYKIVVLVPSIGVHLTFGKTGAVSDPGTSRNF